MITEKLGQDKTIIGQYIKLQQVNENNQPLLSSKTITNMEEFEQAWSSLQNDNQLSYYFNIICIMNNVKEENQEPLNNDCEFDLKKKKKKYYKK